MYVKGALSMAFYGLFCFVYFCFWWVLTPDEELWHLDFSRKFKFLGLAEITDRRCNVRCPCGLRVSLLHTPYSVLSEAPLERER